MRNGKIKLYIRSTGGGIKVVEHDYLGEKHFTKHNRRYCYGENAEEKAMSYAKKRKEQLENGDYADDISIVGLDEYR